MFGKLVTGKMTTSKGGAVKALAREHVERTPDSRKKSHEKNGKYKVPKVEMDQNTRRVML